MKTIHSPQKKKHGSQDGQSPERSREGPRTRSRVFFFRRATVSLQPPKGGTDSAHQDAPEREDALLRPVLVPSAAGRAKVQPARRQPSYT